MTDIQNAVAKTRVQLDLASTEVERMHWIMSVCQLDTRKDLFNNALSLFEWAVEESMKGRALCSIDPETNERVTLSMVPLNNAARHEGTYRKIPSKSEAREEKAQPKRAVA